MAVDCIPARQVRAVFDETTITVYQAYSSLIAHEAVLAGKFVAPFKRERMTWIKPSFLWMMYRSGWATKPGQERILAIKIARDGFEWALTHSCLSHWEPNTYANRNEWAERKQAAPVRVQWDPERSLSLTALDQRAIQIGLSGEAVDRYVDEWMVEVTDITTTARTIASIVEHGDLDAARRNLPNERPYPLPADIKVIVAAT